MFVLSQILEVVIQGFPDGLAQLQPQLLVELKRSHALLVVVKSIGGFNCVSIGYLQIEEKNGATSRHLILRNLECAAVVPKHIGSHRQQFRKYLAF